MHLLFGNLQDCVNSNMNTLCSHLPALLHEITAGLYPHQVLGLSTEAVKANVKRRQENSSKPITFLLSSNLFLKARHKKQDARIPRLSFITFALNLAPEGKSCLREPRRDMWKAITTVNEEKGGGGAQVKFYSELYCKGTLWDEETYFSSPRALHIEKRKHD